MPLDVPAARVIDQPVTALPHKLKQHNRLYSDAV